jgi:hypothetical protein
MNWHAMDPAQLRRRLEGAAIPGEPSDLPALALQGYKADVWEHRAHGFVSQRVFGDVPIELRQKARVFFEKAF